MSNNNQPEILNIGSRLEKVIEQLEDLMRCYLAAGLIGEYIGLRVALELIRRGDEEVISDELQNWVDAFARIEADKPQKTLFDNVAEWDKAIEKMGYIN